MTALWPLILRALGPLLRLLGLGALYAKGRSDARTGAALEAAERKARAHETRREIEDEIADDPHLAARARAAGLVRPGRK